MIDCKKNASITNFSTIFTKKNLKKKIGNPA